MLNKELKLIKKVSNKTVFIVLVFLFAAIWGAVFALNRIGSNIIEKDYDCITGHNGSVGYVDEVTLNEGLSQIFGYRIVRNCVYDGPYDIVLPVGQ